LSTESEINQIQSYLKRAFNIGNYSEMETSKLTKLKSEEKSKLINEGYLEKTNSGVYILSEKGKIISKDTSYIDEVEKIDFRNTCELLTNCYNNDYNFHNITKCQRKNMKRYKLVSKFTAGIPLLTKLGVSVLGITDQIAIDKHKEYRDKFWKPIQDIRRAKNDWKPQRRKKNYKDKYIVIS
jgi:hypothetical protein